MCALGANAKDNARTSTKLLACYLDEYERALPPLLRFVPGGMLRHTDNDRCWETIRDLLIISPPGNAAYEYANYAPQDAANAIRNRRVYTRTERYLSRDSAEDCPGTPGLKWVSVGNKPPSQGKELFSSALSRELELRSEFTEEELRTWEVGDVNFHDFIRSRKGGYFETIPQKCWDLWLRLAIVSGLGAVPDGRHEIQDKKVKEILKRQIDKKEFFVDPRALGDKLTSLKGGMWMKLEKKKKKMGKMGMRDTNDQFCIVSLPEVDEILTAVMDDKFVPILSWITYSENAASDSGDKKGESGTLAKLKHVVVKAKDSAEEMVNSTLSRRDSINNFWSSQLRVSLLAVNDIRSRALREE
jgi:hypothetical protein